MYSYNIAIGLKKNFSFNENSHLATHKLEGGTIMSIQFKFWMALVLYLIYLGCMAFIIIMVLIKHL